MKYQLSFLRTSRSPLPQAQGALTAHCAPQGHIRSQLVLRDVDFTPRVWFCPAEIKCVTSKPLLSWVKMHPACVLKVPLPTLQIFGTDQAQAPGTGALRVTSDRNHTVRTRPPLTRVLTGSLTGATQKLPCLNVPAQHPPRHAANSTQAGRQAEVLQSSHAHCKCASRTHSFVEL